jgi:molybdenum-dependent DNA-binding transcriptional regulator ModE
MKQLFTLISVFLMSITSSYGQLTINQSIVPKSTYKVGDTIQINYTVARGTSTPRYFWLRYQFNNKALTYLSTTWSQGSSVQTFYTGWSNFRFTPNQTVSNTNLFGQYSVTPWSYSSNPDWNVGQLTVQRTDAPIDGVIATQRYIIKDLGNYTDIHKLDLSYSVDSQGVNISPITTTTGLVSLTNVVGNTSQFKVRVLFPSGYDITSHSVSLLPLTSSGQVNWGAQSISTKPLDPSGEAVFTTEVKVGDTFAVFVNASTQKTFMNNIVTVSDAYRAFLGVTQTDISGVSNYFTDPLLEKRIGLVTKNKTSFSESDSYNLFAHVMGVDVSANASIFSNVAPVNGTVNFKWMSGLLNQSWLNGEPTYITTITQPTQSVDMVYSWGGDLDYSHSSSSSEITSRIASGNTFNSTNKNTQQLKLSSTSMSYTSKVNDVARLSVISRIEGGKVVLTTNLTKEGLAGLQVIMNYDDSKLTLDEVKFDSGSAVTNFTTQNGSRLTFGSMDQTKTSRIKVGTPYRLIFTPKTTLTNTSGLFFFVLSDAVDGSGNKVDLIIE